MPPYQVHNNSTLSPHWAHIESTLTDGAGVHGFCGITRVVAQRAAEAIEVTALVGVDALLVCGATAIVDRADGRENPMADA